MGNKKKWNWFTLVELIVVIVILSILATIAFLSFWNQSSSARDSQRMTDLSNISKWLWVEYTNKWNYPIPENYITIYASWIAISYQWKAWDTILRSSKLSSWWKDPLDSSYYTYSTNIWLNKFQLLWFLENWSSMNVRYDITNKTYAADLTNRTPFNKWDVLGIILDSTTKEPIENLKTSSFTWVDIVKTGSWFDVHFNNKENVSWTWIILSFVANQWAKNCNEILKRDPSKKWKDWYYDVNPSMSSNSWTVKVYCDMTNQWGWWDQIKNFYKADVLNWACEQWSNKTFSSCVWVNDFTWWVNSWENEQIDTWEYMLSFYAKNSTTSSCTVNLPGKQRLTSADWKWINLNFPYTVNKSLVRFNNVFKINTSWLFNMWLWQSAWSYTAWVCDDNMYYKEIFLWRRY